jgi:O-antigen ligase
MFRWYYLASCFFILQVIGSSSFIARMYYGEWSGGFEQTTKLQIFLNLAMVAVSLSLFGRGVQRTRTISTGGILAITFSFLLILSTAWSIDPSITLRRGFLYLFFVLGLIGMAANLKREELMSVLIDAFFFSAVVSIVLVAVAPSTAFMGSGAPDNPWAMRGLFSHKNVLGEVMVAGALVSVHRFREGGKGRLWSAVQCLTFLLVAIASKSATSLLIILYIYAASALIMLYRRGGSARAIALLLTAFLVPGAVVADLAQNYVLSLLGKDPTLTGRTELWAIVTSEIFDRPLQGWGFFAFWDASNPVANDISASLGWEVPNAHNGLLEMLLETGFVGTGFVIAMLIRNATLAVRCLRTSAAEVATTTLLCYSAIIFTSITESVMMDSAEPMTGIFFLLGFICEASVRAPRQQHSASKRMVAKQEVKSLPSWRPNRTLLNS